MTGGITGGVLLNAATATGAGSTLKLEPNLFKDHTVQITDTGNATAITVDLEGSLDDVTWFQLASHSYDAAEITADAAMFHVVDKLVNFVRANLITLTAGTAPTVTAIYSGS